jgi:hypothetical protein
MASGRECARSRRGGWHGRGAGAGLTDRGRRRSGGTAGAEPDGPPGRADAAGGVPADGSPTRPDAGPVWGVRDPARPSQRPSFMKTCPPPRTGPRWAAPVVAKTTAACPRGRRDKGGAAPSVRCADLTPEVFGFGRNSGRGRCPGQWPPGGSGAPTPRLLGRHRAIPFSGTWLGNRARLRAPRRDGGAPRGGWDRSAESQGSGDRPARRAPSCRRDRGARAACRRPAGGSERAAAVARPGRPRQRAGDGPGGARARPHPLGPDPGRAGRALGPRARARALAPGLWGRGAFLPAGAGVGLPP